MIIKLEQIVKIQREIRESEYRKYTRIHLQLLINLRKEIFIIYNHIFQNRNDYFVPSPLILQDYKNTLKLEDRMKINNSFNSCQLNRRFNLNKIMLLYL